jgi:uncharacterized protein
MSPSSTPPVVPTDSKNDSLWAMLCHLTSLVAYLGIPFGNILGPLIVWLIKKNEIPLVDDQGKESLNFQLSITIYAIVSFVLVFAFVGFPLLVAVVLFHIIATILASIKASQGIAYRYPLCIRFIK